MEQVFPDAIIEEILSRTPVKSIIRFESASKHWFQRISDPSFAKFHFERASANHRTALFFSAYDESTRKRYLLSASNEGGTVDHLMTLDAACTAPGSIQAEHLNGLVCFTFINSFVKYSCAEAFVLNPSTHKIFKIPDPGSLPKESFGNEFICSLFGFDETRNQHKILMIRKVNFEVQVMIFAVSTSSSWRQIDAELPVGFSFDPVGSRIQSSACVNSVIHMLPLNSSGMLGFDLSSEKFIVTSIPEAGVVPLKSSIWYVSSGKTLVKSNDPLIIKINGCIGLVCHEHVVENNEMDIWILQNHDYPFWVKEVVTFPAPWTELGEPYPSDSINLDEIIFTSSKVSSNNVLIYNTKTRCFRSLDFTFDDRQFLCPEDLKFNHIRCHLESMLPFIEEQNNT